MLEGFANTDEFELARFLNAETVVHHRSQLEMLRQREWTFGNRVWLKLDTGMHRLGFPLEETWPGILLYGVSPDADHSAIDVATGDRVVLWGEGLPVESVAPWADAVPCKLICGVTGRVPRIAG